jgi:RNA polymerase sigma-70 factor (ECF subfamily)
MGAVSMRNGNATNRTTTENERKLLAAVARRDRQAFARLYRIYQPRLYGYLRRFAANPVVVEEVVDDVMFVVWTDAKKFRGKSAVSSWIFGIAYRKALTALRREGRYEAPLRRDVETVDPNSVSRADIELIQAGLAGLSPDHRQVIELTYFCGYSYQEIAEIADCPVNTVKTRMFHARRRLKVLLPRLAGENTEQKHDQL